MLKDHVPPFLLESKVFQANYDVQQNELDSYNNAINDIADQCFVETATWGLNYWEEFLGITVDGNRPYDFRRSIIKAKLRGTGTITVKLIKNVAESYNNGEVEVIEHNEDYYFTIKFIAHDGIPQNLTDLKKAIEDIKPAHLAVTYDFKYMVWDVLDAKKITWDALDSKKISWDMFETGIW